MELRLPTVIGHRGAAAQAPENTLAGLRVAAEQGATWVEFDAMLSADGVPILFHDDSLQRTTGRDGLVAETDWRVLRELDAGSYFGEAFADERVPSLAEALNLLLDLGLHPNIEIKPTPGRDVETAVRVVEVTAEVWPRDRQAPYFCSFSAMALAAQRALRPDWPSGFNGLRHEADWQERLRALGCGAYHLLEREITPDLAATIKAAGYGLVSFTVNDPARARALRGWGVDSLVTDSPREILAALAA